MAAAAPAGTSQWDPLRMPIFRALWLASLASNLGTWMHIVAASWLMTSLTASASLVALIQTASSIPAFALSLPAGALADVIDRRRMLIATQGWQLLVAATLGAIALSDAATPGVLLALTLALGAGAALGMPVFWAIIPELVPRDRLPAAVSLNSASFTVAQAIGPTLGGLLVATVGPGAVFMLNAVSFAGIVAVAGAWRRAPHVTGSPPEQIVGALRAGARYVANARPLQVVLFRVATHVLFFSALPALLVVVTRTELHVGAGTYGALYGCFGVGGLMGALLLPRLRERVAVDRLVALAAIALAVGIATLATLRTVPALFPVTVLAGAGSMTVLSSLNIAAQSVLPSWVRGRGLAIHLFTVQVGIAVGAALWGAVASNLGVSTALLMAAAGIVATHLLSGLAGAKLAVTERVDLTPARWSEPALALEPEPGEGPIRVEIGWRIGPEDTTEFLAAMREVRRTRRRDGAMQWSLFQDLSDPEHHVESFLVASWAEHERQPERAVRSDRAAVERALALHRGDGPRVVHLLAHDFRRGRAGGRGKPEARALPSAADHLLPVAYDSEAARLLVETGEADDPERHAESRGRPIDSGEAG